MSRAICTVPSLYRPSTDGLMCTYHAFPTRAYGMKSVSVQRTITITILDASMAQNNDTNHVVQEMMLEMVQELKSSLQRHQSL